MRARPSLFRSPRARLAVGTAFILAALGAPTLVGGVWVAVAAVVACVTHGVERSAVWRGLRGPLGMLVVLAVLRGGLALLGAGPGVAPSTAMMDFSAGLPRLSLRVLGACLWGVWTTSVVLPHEIWATLRALGVAPEILEILALGSRYVVLFRRDAERLATGAKLRLGLSRWRSTVHVVPSLGGSIVLRAATRAEAIGHALALRGYTGSVPLPLGDDG